MNNQAIVIAVYIILFALLMTGRNLEHAYFALRKVRLWMWGKPDNSRKAQRKRAEKRKEKK